MSSIGNTIRTYRQIAGLTQTELAQKLSITKSAVSNYERGIRIPDISLLQPIADAINVDVSLLMLGINEYTDNELADAPTVHPTPAEALQEQEVVNTVRRMTKDNRDIYLGIGKQILLTQNDPDLYFSYQVLPRKK